jgi:hypothetical protein
MGTKKEGSISKRDVFEMAGVVPTKWIDGLFDVCAKNSFDGLQVTFAPRGELCSLG